MTVEEYLASFEPIANLSMEALWREMDKVWDDLGLDNKQDLSTQSERVAQFYRHPVWILNGIFSEIDPLSRSHRVAIARRVCEFGVHRIADYGGGSGVLARLICQQTEDISIDIIEPFPCQYFLEKITHTDGVRYIPELTGSYDLVIAQDVLEHVDDPINLTIRLIQSIGEGGYLIFANCFFPVIKCHLPSTFYLRHQFKLLLRFSGLQYIGRVNGAEYALIFKKRGKFRERRFERMANIGRAMPWTNTVGGAVAGLRQFTSGLLRHFIS